MGKIAAVLGGANGGLDDLRSFQRLAKVRAVFAVNDAAAEYPGPLAAFVTLHPEKLPVWLERRWALELPAPDEIVAHEAQKGVTRVVDYRWPGMNASGSSGLFAVKVALEAGFDRVVLCGVPMDTSRTRHAMSTFHNDRGSFLDAWKIALPHLRDRVRSFNGWTRDLLGPPTPDWLASVA